MDKYFAVLSNNKNLIWIDKAKDRKSFINEYRKHHENLLNLGNSDCFWTAVRRLDITEKEYNKIPYLFGENLEEFINKHTISWGYK